MEALGRTIAVALSAIGLLILLFFYRTASVRWQKEETIRSMCQTFAENILEQRSIPGEDWNEFEERINLLGAYRTEVTVYERRMFEGENGRVYLYVRRDAEETKKEIPEGSYVRIVVTEAPRGKAETFFFGEGCVLYAGGRVS